MKIKPLIVLTIIMMGGAAEAALHDRGNGLIYDDVLNITWSQDAGLGGARFYDDALQYADQLIFGGYNDWRLPTMSRSAGDAGTATIVDCRVATEQACRDNELGYHFHYHRQNPDIEFSNFGIEHWSTTKSDIPGMNWGMDVRNGTQLLVSTSDQVYRNSWMVRDGDVTPSVTHRQFPFARGTLANRYRYGDALPFTSSQSFDLSGLPQFDPAEGELVNVHLEVIGSMNTLFSEFLMREESSLDARMIIEYELTSAFIGPDGDDTAPESVVVYGGIAGCDTNFGSADNCWHNLGGDNFVVGSHEIFESGPDLANFIGTGNLGGYQLKMTMNFPGLAEEENIREQDSYIFSFSFYEMASARVTYRYIAITPASDSDLDGLPDPVEAPNTPPPTGVDTDMDGVDDALDVDITGGLDQDNNGEDDALQAVDSDSDGLADYLDTDSDNDGISDVVEGTTTGDITDTDADGISDQFDVNQTGGTDANRDGVDDDVVAADTDADGVPDYLDLDTDNDGLLDVQEAGLSDSNRDGIVDDMSITDTPADTDANGIANFRALDSDGDGITDIQESAFAEFDDNDDGRIDDATDGDGDGVPDVVDGQPTMFGTSPDTDEDGVADLLDLDDDNDGIPDSVESADIDSDRDTDGDGMPDRIDLDSDNDGIPDLLESDPNNLDLNVDGQHDDFVDANGDGLSDSIATTFAPMNTTGTGSADFRELDSDGDTIFDIIEAGGEALDGNDDGMIDDATDSDRDGLRDIVDGKVTGGTAGAPLVPADTDNDGVADHRDTDSDNDGVADSAETGDLNNDGIADRLQAAPEPEVEMQSSSGNVGIWALALFIIALLRRRSLPVTKA